MSDQPKSVWYSKTAILNALTFIATTGLALQGETLIQSYPRATAILGSVLAVTNIALRLITKVPVTW